MEERLPLRKTKIIVTLGSSSSSVEAIKGLIHAGMDMARISDRFVPNKQQVLENVRTAIHETQTHVGVMLGLRESDMRIASLNQTEALQLEEGQRVLISTSLSHQPTLCTLYCNNTEFPSLVMPGDKLLIDFGKIVFTVLSLECDLEEEEAEERAKRLSGMKTHNIIYSLNSPQGSRPLPKSPNTRITSFDSSPRPARKGGMPCVQSSDTLPITRIKRAPKPEKHHVLVVCRVEHDCVLLNSKPMHISPHDDRPHPISYSNDVEDIKNIRWAIDNDIDVVVFKQVRDANDFVNYGSAQYRRFIGIQNKDNIAVSRELVDITDGCVIGRGMMALETSLSEVCRVQKDVASYCNKEAKPIVISTQLLESMVNSLVPSQSEVNDITNAVFDGCDALLLSGETAYGRHPIRTLEACSQICLETERSEEYARISGLAMQTGFVELSVAEDICYCAVQSVLNIGAVLIICISHKGVSAQALSKYKPPCPILALTDNLRTLKFLRIVRGIIPAMMEGRARDFFTNAVEMAKERRLAQAGDYVVYIGGGSDSFTTGDTCTLRISKVIT
jgi:pyruvate kinase